MDVARGVEKTKTGKVRQIELEEGTEKWAYGIRLWAEV